MGVGTDNNVRATGDGNWQFTDGSTFRLSVMRQKGDVAGRDHVETDRMGVAPSLEFGLGTPTRVTLRYYHLQNDDTPDMGIPFRNESRPDRVTPPNVDRSTYYGILRRDYRNNQADMGTVMIEHDFTSTTTLRNATHYSR